jgi:hypothetical protein
MTAVPLLPNFQTSHIFVRRDNEQGGSIPGVVRTLYISTKIIAGYMRERIERTTSDLKIEEHLPLHERGWIVQKAGLALLIGLVLCCGFGLFGDGVASKRKLHANGVEIEFQRYYRFEAPMDVKVEMKSNTVGNTISFPSGYLKNFKIESIVPEPSENKFNGDQVEYYFDGGGRILVTFHFIPQTIGNIAATINVNQKPVTISHFIYP